MTAGWIYPSASQSEVADALAETDAQIDQLLNSGQIAVDPDQRRAYLERLTWWQQRERQQLEAMREDTD